MPKPRSPPKRIWLPARLHRDVLRGDEPLVSHRADHILPTAWTDRVADTLIHEREQTIPYLLQVLKSISHNLEN